MKKIILISIFIEVLCGYSLEDLAVFNTPLEVNQTKVVKKECYIICKKQLTHAQKIQQALDFYKMHGYNSSDTKKRSR